jgi:ribokinase
LIDVVGLGALNVDIIYEIKRPFFPSEVKLEKGREIFTSEEEFEAVKSWINRVGRLVWQSGGGQAANTCYALSRIGVSTGFLGVVGEDKFGDFVFETLQGVDTSRIKRRGKTGICLAILDERGERTLMIFPNTNDTLSFKDIDVKYASQAKFLYLSSFVGGSPLKAQIELVKKIPRDVKVAYDPGAIHAGRKWEEISILISHSNILFLNEEELKMLAGKKEDKAVNSLFSLGVEIIVLKRGEKGSTVFTKESFFHVPAEKVDVVDTTGAGDVYAAGFITSLLRGLDIHSSAKIATKMAAISVQGYGRENYPRREDFDLALKEVMLG